MLVSLVGRETMESDCVNILGVKVNCVTKEKLLQTITLWTQEDEKRTVTYVNAHGLNLAYTQASFQTLLNQADLIYSDGIGGVWASRFLNGCKFEKITGREWIYDFCDLAVKQDLKLYIIAGSPGIARQARDHLLSTWPDLKIVGVCDGYFVKKNEAQALSEIQRESPDVIFIGMGSPLQEQWISIHRDAIPAKIFWAVGALFDNIAGLEPSVPTWMNSLALEWLWRLFMDPAGKWRRYLVGIPLFAIRVIQQKMTQ
jgi:N-acetylglucosaminyldiphosphoundecaprenol N-acetyl-beta-D-mannosaminyltransferase